MVSHSKPSTFPLFPSGFIVYITCASVTDASVSTHHRGVWSPSQLLPRVLYSLSRQAASCQPLSLRHSLSAGPFWLMLCVLSHIQLFVTPWTVPCQAPLSVGFSRQEYCSGLPCPPPGDLPHPGIKPMSPVAPALAGKFFTTVSPGKPSFLKD